MYSIFWNVFLSYSWKQAESSLFGEFIMFNFWKKKKMNTVEANLFLACLFTQLHYSRCLICILDWKADNQVTV